MKITKYHIIIVVLYIIMLFSSQSYAPYSKEISNYEDSTIKDKWIEPYLFMSASSKEAKLIEKAIFYGLEEYTLVLVHISTCIQKIKARTNVLSSMLNIVATGWMFLFSQYAIFRLLLFTRFKSDNKVVSKSFNSVLSFFIESIMGYLFSIVLFWSGKLFSIDITSSISKVMLFLIEEFQAEMIGIVLGVIGGIALIIISFHYLIAFFTGYPWARISLRCAILYIMLHALFWLFRVTQNLTGWFPPSQLAVIIIGFTVCAWKSTLVYYNERFPEIL